LKIIIIIKGITISNAISKVGAKTLEWNKGYASSTRILFYSNFPTNTPLVFYVNIFLYFSLFLPITSSATYLQA
jgi:hypothetical protein